MIEVVVTLILVFLAFNAGRAYQFRRDLGKVYDAFEKGVDGKYPAEVLKSYTNLFTALREE